MLRKIFAILALCAVLITSFGETSALAATTLEKYTSSGIAAVTTKATYFYAEPNSSSYIITAVQAGTPFVPINQQNNAKENKVYNLVINSNGQVGWIDADLLKIVPKK